MISTAWTTIERGAIAEIEIVAAATKLGIPVLKPVAEHGRADLALDIGSKLWRVQCKWGRLSKGRDVVIVHVETSRLTNNGYVRTTYTASEVDLFGVLLRRAGPRLSLAGEPHRGHAPGAASIDTASQRPACMHYAC